MLISARAGGGRGVGGYNRDCRASVNQLRSTVDHLKTIETVKQTIAIVIHS